MRNLWIIALALGLSACATSTFTPVAVNGSDDYYLAESGYYGSYPPAYRARSNAYGFGSWWYSGGAYSPVLYSYYSPYYYPHQFAVWNFPYNNSPFAYGMYGRNYFGWGYPYWSWCPPIRGPVITTGPGQRQIVDYSASLDTLKAKQSYLYEPWARNDLRMDSAILKQNSVHPRSTPRYSTRSSLRSTQKAAYPSRSFTKPSSSSVRPASRSTSASSRGSTRIATRGSTRASSLDKN